VWPSTVAPRRGIFGWDRPGTEVPGYLPEIATRLVPPSAWATLRALNRYGASNLAGLVRGPALSPRSRSTPAA